MLQYNLKNGIITRNVDDELTLLLYIRNKIVQNFMFLN